MGLPRHQLKSYDRDELEESILCRFRDMLILRDWGVFRTHGNMFQSGWPDLYIAHYKHGVRWVEMKRPTGYKFTPAQHKMFPELKAKGVGVWIIWSADETSYNSLFGPDNFTWAFAGHLIYNTPKVGTVL